MSSVRELPLGEASQCVALCDEAGMERIRKTLRLDPQIVRRVRTALYKRFAGVEAALEEVPAPVRDRFDEMVDLRRLSLARRADSQIDGASKLILQRPTGEELETVILRIESGRTSLCISSQVGCAAACKFCATGQMGMARSLSTVEILDQIVVAGEIIAAEARQLRNIVFMGMGEPFHNEERLYEVLAALVNPRLFHRPPGQLLVSTVGIPEAMIRCARRFPEVRLALSLHSVDQQVRSDLIPVADKYRLDELRQALVVLNRIQRHPVMIEYLMLSGVNDSLAAARDLATWLQGLHVHVNLIPFNPIESAPGLQSTSRADRDAFAEIVRDAGFTATIRYSLGADIGAACGQLVRRHESGAAGSGNRS